MVNTLFSAFTWYVTSIVAPPSIGFLLLGFIFGPVMLDYAVRFNDAVCEQNGEDLAGPLISFLRLEGLVVTLFWCAAAVWLIFRLFTRSHKQADDTDSLSALDFDSDKRHGFGEALIFVMYIFFAGAVATGALVGSYFVWGPSYACKQSAEALWSRVNNLLVAHWVITILALLFLLSYYWCLQSGQIDRFLKRRKTADAAPLTGAYEPIPQLAPAPPQRPHAFKPAQPMPEPLHVRIEPAMPVVERVIEIHSVDQLREALVEAADRICVVFFYAQWSLPCRSIAPQFASLSGQFPNFIFLQIDVDIVTSAREYTQLTGLPTIGFYKNRQKLREKTLEGSNCSLLAYTLLELKMLGDI